LGVPWHNRDPGAVLCFSIVPVARRDSQIISLHADLELVKRIGRERDVSGIEAQQILRAKLLENVGESAADSGAEVAGEDSAAGALAERRERVLAADVAARVVSDRHHEDGVDDGVRQLRGLERGVKILDAGGVTAVGNDDNYLAPLAALEVT